MSQIEYASAIKTKIPSSMIPLKNKAKIKPLQVYVFALFYALLSLPYARKAASAAPKISTKPLAERCKAVFAELLFGKTSKIPKRISVDIFEGFSAVLAESSQRKPIRVRFPSA